MKMVVLDGETANPGDNPWTPIETLGELAVYARTETGQVVERARDAEIILTNKVFLDDSVMEQLPKLKLICVLATGYNVVDVEAAHRREIVVSNVPEYSTESVAQFVFAGLLSFIHRPELHHEAILAGQWQASNNFSFWKKTTTELAGKTMGIVGLGRIGRAVARIASAFGMQVVANSRTKSEPPFICGANDDYTGDSPEQPSFQWVDLPTLFATSDVVTLHCPQTTENTGFVNGELISKMKHSAILINTARGGLVNENDLAAALNSQQIAGAVLDVVSSEPISNESPLLTAQNCLITPHLAWATIEARRRLLQITAKNIAAFVAGQPINVVGA